MAAFTVAQPQEGLGQDAALEEGVKLVLDESRQLGAGTGLGVRDEAGRVLLHQAVQRGLLGAVAFVVKRGAVRFVPPAEGPPSSVLLWSDRRLQGDEVEAMDVAAGS